MLEILIFDLGSNTFYREVGDDLKSTLVKSVRNLHPGHGHSDEDLLDPIRITDSEDTEFERMRSIPEHNLVKKFNLIIEIKGMSEEVIGTLRLL